MSTIILNEISINKCKEYVKPAHLAQFDDFIKRVDIRVSTKTKTKWWSGSNKLPKRTYDYHFIRHKPKINPCMIDLYTVTLDRRISFTFEWFGDGGGGGDDDNTTKPDLYSILVGLGNDYMTGEILGTFEVFCREFDYATYSRRSRTLFKEMKEQYDKLCTVMTLTDANAMPQPF